MRAISALPRNRQHSQKPTGGARLSRRARHSAEVRQRLFRSAIRLFADRGYLSTRVEDITEAAGVAKGTFFNYFPTKEHLLIRFGEERIRLIGAALDRARRAEGSIRDILRDLWLDLTKEPTRSRELASSLIITMLGANEAQQQVSRLIRRARGLLARLIALGHQRGEIRRDRRPLELAGDYQKMYFGSILIWALDRTIQLAAWREESFALYWSAVGARPHAQKGRPQ